MEQNCVTVSLCKLHCGRRTCSGQTPHGVHADSAGDVVVMELTQHQQQVRHHFQLMQQSLGRLACLTHTLRTVPPHM